jgi:hypothetical protein
MGTRAGLKALGAAAATRHAFYDLDGLAVLVLTLKAQEHPTAIAAVGCLFGGGGGNLGRVLPYN